MASTSLLHSTSSSFAGVRLPFRSSAAPLLGFSSLSVRAAAGTAVFVDKSEAETINRLKTAYLEKIIPLLKDEFSYSNILEVPKVEKIVVNCGIGDASQNAKGLDAAINELALITGQRPVKTKAKTSIAGFKVREGMTLGIAVTLRGNLMYSFLDRLINLALPRTRDFQGVNPNSFLMASAALQGASIGLLIDLAIQIDASILVSVFVGCGIAFGCLLAAAISAKRREYLHLGHIIFDTQMIIEKTHFGVTCCPRFPDLEGVEIILSGTEMNPKGVASTLHESMEFALCCLKKSDFDGIVYLFDEFFFYEGYSRCSWSFVVN